MDKVWLSPGKGQKQWKEGSSASVMMSGGTDLEWFTKENFFSNSHKFKNHTDKPVCRSLKALVWNGAKFKGEDYKVRAF